MNSSLRISIISVLLSWKYTSATLKGLEQALKATSGDRPANPISDHKILSHDKDQLVPPISQQALGDLIWRGLDAPVSHRSQSLRILFPLHDRT